MNIETITTTMLTASEGHILTDGEVYGRVIYLGADRSAEEFHEITDAEYEAKMAELEPQPFV